MVSSHVQLLHSNLVQIFETRQPSYKLNQTERGLRLGYRLEAGYLERR